MNGFERFSQKKVCQPKNQMEGKLQNNGSYNIWRGAFQFFGYDYRNWTSHLNFLNLLNLNNSLFVFKENKYYHTILQEMSLKIEFRFHRMTYFCKFLQLHLSYSIGQQAVDKSSMKNMSFFAKIKLLIIRKHELSNLKQRLLQKKQTLFYYFKGFYIIFKSVF